MNVVASAINMIRYFMGILLVGKCKGNWWGCQVRKLRILYPCFASILTFFPVLKKVSKNITCRWIYFATLLIFAAIPIQTHSFLVQTENLHYASSNKGAQQSILCDGDLASVNKFVVDNRNECGFEIWTSGRRLNQQLNPEEHGVLSRRVCFSIEISLQPQIILNSTFWILN